MLAIINILRVFAPRSLRACFSLCAISFAFSMLFAPVVKAQSAVDGFDPNANGTIRSVAVQPDGKVLVGGDFTSMTPNGSGIAIRNRIARLNADGKVDADFNPNANSTVWAIAVQPDGKILIGGIFTTVAPNGGATVARNGIARLNADGTLDAAFNPNASSVESIVVQPDGKILIGGYFHSLAPNGGAAVTRNLIARLNADGTLDASFDPNVSGPGTASVYSIAIQPDGKILIGGDFNSIAPNGGAPVSRICFARLNANGSVDTPFNPNPNSVVYAIAVQPDGKIVIGGSFLSLFPNGGAGIARKYAARLNADGSVDPVFNPTADSSVFSIAIQPDGKILIGGYFTTLAPNGGAAVARKYIARLNADGSLDANFNPSANDFIYSVAAQPDGKILIGGYFNSIAPNGGAAVTRFHIARLERDGRADQSLNAQTNSGGYITATAVQPDGKILIGGLFSSIQGTARNNLARLNTDGTLDTAFNPSVSNAVFSIAVQPDGKILIGGGFLNVNGLARSCIARLYSDGVLDGNFSSYTNDSVFSIAVQPDGKILLGGFFTTANGIARNHLARLNTNASLDTTFNPNANGNVFSTAIQSDGKIIAGGAFTVISGASRNRIARLNADGTIDAAFNPNAGGDVNAVVYQSSGQILIGGSFVTVGGVTRNRIARLNADGTVDAAFNPNADSAVYSIAALADGKTLIGGQFIIVAGTARNRIARLNADGTLDTTFNPNANGIVYTVAPQSDGKILSGGAFTTIGGQPRTNFARLSNATAALSSLAVTKTSVALTRNGSAAQFSRVVFEQSINNGITYTTLGTATGGSSTYTLSGLSLPTGQNLLVRARGFYRTGYQNGSETIEDKTQNVYLSGAMSKGMNISGRVLTADGKGIRNVVVKLTDTRGNFRTAVTTGFGYYRFADLQAGETYIVSATANRFTFGQPTQVVNESQNLNALDFAANP